MIRYLITLIALCLSVVSFASETPCLDPLACNFMEEGECFFADENGDPCVTEGCTIQGACSFFSLGNGASGLIRRLCGIYTAVSRDGSYPRTGHSVRCVRD